MRTYIASVDSSDDDNVLVVVTESYGAKEATWKPHSLQFATRASEDQGIVSCSGGMHQSCLGKNAVHHRIHYINSKSHLCMI